MFSIDSITSEEGELFDSSFLQPERRTVQPQVMNAMSTVIPYCNTKQMGIIKSITAGTYSKDKINHHDKITIGLNIQIKLPTSVKNETSIHIIAIHSGIKGDLVSERCKEILHRYILTDPYFLIHTHTAVVNAFTKLDFEIKEQFNDFFTGAFVIMLMIINDNMYIINLGLGRAVLSTKDEVYFLNKEQLLPESSLILQDKEVGVPSARCISNNVFKKEYLGVFSPVPDIIQFQLTDEMDFIILGCNSLYENVSNSEICDIVASTIADCKNTTNPNEVYTEIIQRIFKHTTELHPKDNLTCAIVFLRDLSFISSSVKKKSNGAYFEKNIKQRSIIENNNNTITSHGHQIQQNVIINNFNNNYKIKQETKIYWCCKRKKKKITTSQIMNTFSFV